jgi:hypothetical protein
MRATFKQFLLTELISTGDDNVLGGLLHNAKINLAKLEKTNPAFKSIINDIKSVFNVIEQDPTASLYDGFSLNQYLQQLCEPTITKNKLMFIRDSIGSYCNSSGE